MTRPTFAQAFACVLNAARRERGLTQEDLATVSGFDRTYPSLLERGLRELKVCSFLRLCEALGASPIALLQDTLQMMRRTALPPLHNNRRGPTARIRRRHRSSRRRTPANASVAPEA